MTRRSFDKLEGEVLRIYEFSNTIVHIAFLTTSIDLFIRLLHTDGMTNFLNYMRGIKNIDFFCLK
jgi:hypothetical protein